MMATADQTMDCNAKLWGVAFRQLSSQEQETLCSGITLPVDFGDLQNAIAEARDHIAANRWKTKARQYFNNALSWLQKFILVGDTIVTYDPGHAALPWAAFRLILQILINDASRSSEFVKGLERVAFYVYDGAGREALYLSSGIYRDSNELRENITVLYSVVLRFLLSAKLFYEAKSGKRILSSFSKSGDDVIALLTPAAERAGNIAIISGRIDAEIGLSTNSSIQSLTNDNHKTGEWLKIELRHNGEAIADLQATIIAQHGETLDRLDSLADQISQTSLDISGRSPKKSAMKGIPSFRRSLHLLRAVDAFQGRFSKGYDRLKVLNWLSSTPYIRHHRAVYDGVLSGTGSWFLNDERFRKWRYATTTSILWLHGPPGSGKSKLTSLVIRAALTGKDSLSFPLYFYCSRNPAEPERAKDEDILQCLVKQLSTSKEENGVSRIPRYVLEKFSQAKMYGFSSGGLGTAESCEIITKYAIDKNTITIIVDALDECQEASKHTILRVCKEIMQKAPSTAIKLLISSRDDVNVPEFFTQFSTYEISIESDRNQGDIDHYVKTQLNALIQQKRIVIANGNPPSQKLNEFIIKSLCDGAQGMFRWVSLQLDYLCTLRSASDIKHRLGRLPKTLETSYADLIKQNVRDYEPEDRFRLSLILSLLLVSSKPVAPIFAAFIFWEPPEEEESDDEGADEAKQEQTEDNNNVSRKDNSKMTGQMIQVLALCFNLVVLDSGGDNFRFAHSSVQDFLEKQDDRQCGLSVDNAVLAQHSISMIIKTFNENPVQPEDSLIAPSSRIKAYGQAPQDKNWNRYTAQVVGQETGLPNEEAVLFAEMNWSDFLASSGQQRERPPLKDLYDELLSKYLELPGSSRRLWVVFAACYYGLDDFVEACIKAAPSLAKTRAQYPIATTALMVACSSNKNRIDIVELLLANGADTTFSNSASHNPWRPVHMALYCGQQDAAALLIKQEGDLSNTETHSDALLMLVLTIVMETKKAVQVLPHLIGQRIPLNSIVDDSLPRLLSPYLHDLTPLLVAAMLNAVECAQILIRHGADPSATSAGGQSALHFATMDPDNKLASILIDDGVDINCAARAGVTPLIWACYTKKLPSYKFLLDRGACLSSDGGGNSPLHILSRWGVADFIAPAVVAHADLNARNKEGITPLLIAAYLGHEETVKALLAHKADVNFCSPGGMTPLNFAARQGHIAILEILLVAGADPNHVNSHGSLAISTASEQGNLGAVKLLLPLTSDVDTQDGDGDTALSNAASNGHTAVAEFLLDNGAAVVPTQPGPHSPAIAVERRMPGYGNDALVSAWEADHQHTVNAILGKSGAAAATQSNDDFVDANKYREGLRLFCAKAGQKSVDDRTRPFDGWMRERIAVALEIFPEMVESRKMVAKEEIEAEDAAVRAMQVEMGWPIGDDNEYKEFKEWVRVVNEGLVGKTLSFS